MSNRSKVTKVTGVVAGATVGTLVALTAALPAFAAPEDPVTFDGQGFKDCIAEELGVDPTSDITEGQMATLTSVLCSDGEEIVNLTGAEYLTSATYFRLYDSPITDVTPLAGLTQLTGVDLGFNENLTDYSPIWGLTNLGTLVLSGSGITSLDGAENLTNLSYIGFSNTEVSDISPLAGLPLTAIWAGSTNVTDISPFNGNTTISDFAIYDSAIGDITPLTTFTNLSSVELTGVPLTDADVAKLGTITDLTSLYLIRTGITDISSLENLTELTQLYVNNNILPLEEPFNKIADISVVSNFTNLESFGADYNQITDVSPLESLNTLEWLYLGGNNITDITPLANLTNLSQLDVADQIHNADTVAVQGTPVDWDVRTLDGSIVAPTFNPTTAGTFDATTNQITYNTNGVVNYSWSVPVVVGSVTTDFTGTGSQVVGSQPAAPTNVVVVPGTDAGTVDLDWDAVTETNGNGDVESYLVQYRLIGASTWIDAEVNAPGVTIGSLTPGAEYEFQVAAITDTGVLGEFSAVVESAAAEDNDTTAPAVAGVEVASVDATSANVTWDAVTDTNGNGDVANYTIAIGTGNSGDSFDVPATANSALVNVTPGTTYTVVVGYTTTTGATGVSAPVTFTAPDAPVVTAPPAITGLVASEGETQGTADIEWLAVSSTAAGTGGNGEVASYTIRYRAVGVEEWITVGTYAGDGTVSNGALINLANGNYEVGITYTTETEVTSPEATTTFTITNGIPNGANGTDGGTTDAGGETGPGETASDITATGADVDHTAILAGVALTALGGVAFLTGSLLRKRKEELV